MAEEKQGASINPDDASGLLDNARVTIKGVKVDVFTSKKGKNAGAQYVSLDVDYASEGQEVTEHYMIGGAEQWTPNATKTQAIPVTEGGRIWNKSDAYKLVKSLVDAGFPKNLLSNDFSIFAGLDVQVARVTQEGQTYKDEKGVERSRTTLLVTKIHTPQDQILSGAYRKGRAGTTAKATPAAAASSSGNTDDSNDPYVTELLVEILTEAKGSVAREKLAQPAFIKITRAKKAAIRQAVTERLQSEAFLSSLAEQGLITFDGKNIALAA